jgi:hypothetical protein
MIMTAGAANGSGPSAKRAGIGTLIGVYALVDLPVGIAIMLLGWWGPAAKVARGQAPAGGQRGDRGFGRLVRPLFDYHQCDHYRFAGSPGQWQAGARAKGPRHGLAFAILFSGLWAFVGWVLNDAT